VLEELRRTHDLGKPKPAASWSLINFKEYRDKLNEHCLALNTPLQGTSWTPQQAMGKLAAIRSTRPESQRFNADVPFENVRWTADELARKRRAVEEASHLLNDIGNPSSNPFSFTRLRSLMHNEEDAIHAEINEACSLHSSLKQAIDNFSTRLGISSDLTIADIERLTVVMRDAFEGSNVYQLRGSLAAWMSKAQALRELIAIGTYATILRRDYSSVVNNRAWDHDCTASRAAIQQHSSSWLRWFSSAYRLARRDVRSITHPSHDFDDTGRLQILDAVIEYQNRRSTIQTAPAPIADLLGSQWRGIETAWADISAIVDKVLAFASASKHGHVDEAIWQYAIHHSDAVDTFRSHATELRILVDRFKSRLQSLATMLDLGDGDRVALISGSLNDIGTRLLSMSGDRQGLQRALRWNLTKRMLTQEQQLSWIVQLIEQEHVPPDILDDVFLMNILTPILRQARQHRPILESGGADRMNTIRQQFKSLDTDSFTAARNEILHYHYNSIPKHTEQGQVGILYREYNKKRRHMPIRRLIEQTHSVIRAMKPVFMMSPKSIAAFLPANTITFDLVVFDEASQIRPVDAFGALLRGRQFVVVGDSMQLPPTNFFNRLLDDDGSDESEEDTSSDIESLLALANSKGVSERTLRWHYRSRHHTLIELSNSRFYQSRLNVIRSPQAVRKDLGLVMHHLPHSVYDRGKSRTNHIEAQEVANAVLYHSRNRPEKTLGVAAFNTYQAEAILDKIEELRREHVELDSYLQSHSEEPFFCKSLENVQGDERDVIFISIGYGRDKDGYLSRAFGAVNRDGGERRLNVLITRARESCHVFSNIIHADIDDSQSRSSGLQALKAFLRYAESGVMDVPTNGQEEGDSPFEDEVARVLEANGFNIAKQVGSAGFRIDIAVKDPNNPSNYILGIECDGATYHSSRSARDRDRLRQQVLENIGWRIYRIWSTDWFRDSQSQARKMIAEINHALNLAKTSVTTNTPAPKPVTLAALPKTTVDCVQRVSSTSSRRDVSGVPYKIAKLNIRLGNRELHEVDEFTMVRWIASVVEVESPVHSHEVITRIADAAGVKRVGGRIHELFKRSVALAMQSRSIHESNDFLHKTLSDDISIRDRSELPPSSRRFDLISDDELDAAILLIVRETYGIGPDELRTAVARVLGFKRVSADIEHRITMRFQHLTVFGRIVTDGSTIRINA
jgi:very-short-patch-repair endonuclease